MNKIVVLFVIGILAIACNKEESESKLIEEEQKLDEWVTSHQPDAVRISNGVYIDVKETSKPIKPEAGQYVLVNYKLWFLDDNTLEMSSFVDDKALYAAKYVFGGPELWQLTAPLVGIYAAIAKMGEGQTANIYFSSRYNEFSGIDFNSRRMQLELVTTIPALSLYQDSLSYYHIASEEDVKIDTIATRSISDQKNYHILYSILNEGRGEGMKGKHIVNTNIQAYYALQKSQKVRYSSEEKINIITDSRFHEFANDNYIDDIVRKMRIGGRLRIAMPSVLFRKYSNMEEQYAVPMGSVGIFDIEIVE
ncbi:MAG: hypothetical protein LBV39_03820 [Bacteroidales bacterium]|jgi:hypothetical protein|nr:hypothetical protein [Bacteroidales bacterium]